jgi:hypothetical protein
MPHLKTSAALKFVSQTYVIRCMSGCPTHGLPPPSCLLMRQRACRVARCSRTCLSSDLCSETQTPISHTPSMASPRNSNSRTHVVILCTGNIFHRDLIGCETTFLPSSLWPRQNFVNPAVVACMNILTSSPSSLSAFGTDNENKDGCRNLMLCSHHVLLAQSCSPPCPHLGPS